MPQMETDRRLDYLDNIRILLTATVIFHHLAVSYGAPGGWYYKEFEFSQLDTTTLSLLTLTAALNQAYFMGFFFFLGGFFSARSVQRQGVPTFLRQRAVRLGLPILLFVYLISPLLRIAFQAIMGGRAVSAAGVAAIYRELRFGVELGPTWFLLLLLLLSFASAPWLGSRRALPLLDKRSSRNAVLLCALLTGLVSFLVRTRLPVGSVFQPLNLQVPHLAQYIVLFLLGSLAYRGAWLDRSADFYRPLWPLLAAGLVLAMPPLFILSGGLEGNVTPALGGWHWQALAYALWEQLFCASLMLTLLQAFKRHADRSTWLTRELAASSYAAYLIHPLILVVVAALLGPIRLHPLAKIGILLLPVLALCFLAGGLLRRLPGLRKVL